MKLEIDDVLVDKIVLQTLKDDFMRVNRDIVSLKASGALVDYEKSDLEYWTALSNNIFHVIQYYLSHDDFHQWVKNSTKQIEQYTQELTSDKVLSGS